MDLKTVGNGMTALPSLDAELEKAAAEEQEKQREKVKDIFVAQVLYCLKFSVIKTIQCTVHPRILVIFYVVIPS